MNFRVLTFLILACLFPSSVFAFWVNQVDICEAEPISVVNLPCQESEDGEENNVCLEAAAFPISTTQSLLKMMESWNDQNGGEDVLKQIAEVAISMTSVGNVDGTEWVSMPPKTPVSPRSCLASNLADCEFVPGTPTIQLIATAIYGSVSASDLYTTTSTELDYRSIHTHRYQFSHEDLDRLPSVPPPQSA